MISNELVKEFNFVLLQTIKWKAYLGQKLSMNINYLNNFYHDKIIRPFFYIYNYDFLPNLFFVGSDVTVYHLINEKTFGDFLKNSPFVEFSSFPVLNKNVIKSLIASFYKFREYCKNRILDGYKIKYSDVQNINQNEVDRYYNRNFIQFINSDSVINPVKEFQFRGIYYVPVLVFDANTFKTWKKIVENEVNVNKTIVFHKKEVNMIKPIVTNKQEDSILTGGQGNNQNLYINCIVLAHLLPKGNDLLMTLYKIRTQLKFTSKYTPGSNNKENYKYYFLLMLSKLFSFYSVKYGVQDVFSFLLEFTNSLINYIKNGNDEELLTNLEGLEIVRNLKFKMPASLGITEVYKILDLYTKFTITNKLVFLMQVLLRIVGQNFIYCNNTGNCVQNYILSDSIKDLSFPMINKLFIRWLKIHLKDNKVEEILPVAFILVTDEHMQFEKDGIFSRDF